MEASALITAIAVGIIGVVVGLLGAMLGKLRSQHLVVAISVRDLAATVAKMQADQRTQPRAAGAPPVGAFSFKGASK